MPAPEISRTYAGSLFVETYGGKAVIRRSDDQDEQQLRLFGAVPDVPGNAVVLASTAAGREPGFRAALRDACRVALSTARGSADQEIHRLWVAVPGLGHSDPQGHCLAQKLAKDFTVNVFAPDGPLTLTADGTIFAGSDHHSWRLFAPAQRKQRYFARYPLPVWEALMPRGAVTASGLVAEPIPAGMSVREADAPDRADIGHGLPVSRQHPRILLGRPGDAPIAPRRIADLLSRFPAAFRANLQLVPTDPETAGSGWMKRLAELLGHDVFAATGYLRHEGPGVESAVVYDEHGQRAWQPFPVALRHASNGRAQAVAAGPPPLGWVRSGPLEYREVESGGAVAGRDEIMARVIPAGLALTTAGESGAADQLAFEPDRMTVAVGSPCRSLAGGTPRALHRLIAGLAPEHRSRLRLLVLGTAHERMREAIRAAAGELADRVEVTAVVPATDTVTAAEQTMEIEPVESPPTTDIQAPVDDARLETVEAPNTHPAGENHAPPQDANPPALDRAPGEVVAPPLPPRPVTVSSPPESLLTEPSPPALRRDVDAPAEDDSETTPPSRTAGAPDPVAEPEQEDQPASDLVPAQPRERRYPPGHRSTAAERSGLARLVGAEFDAALPTVNAALANYPALRAGVNQDEKADFVAVCLYVGDGEYGANAVNRMLRNDEPGADVYLACLTSGLQRLPVHRGPAYRMVLLHSRESSLDVYRTGNVLTEPGFVSATAAIDVTSAEAHADLVIWSRSARRTAAFGRSGLPDEVVFLSDSRFKVLAVEQPEATERDASAPAAVLMRELGPDEATTPGTLHDADLTVLPKLKRALGRRHSAQPREIDAPEQLERIGAPVGMTVAAAQIHPSQEGHS
ncbi:hypothetical protein MOQ72_08610 [Saccharopolyspora sp. K220]|uniref:hypothetical protein n=1 Tax=Saccharopolyspora soli TaxID=2926618 RepID=UPI001F58C0F1|nr:hypothetical protein [Saccharopolyspora soli]MCI2417483.1 hypothetical protein [Saccharopolyspora soli]